MSQKGQLIWITGLSGSGKTTLSSGVYQAMLEYDRPVIFLDGDELRDTVKHLLGYSKADRLNNAIHHSRLCRLLTNQGFDVIIAVIGLYHEIHQWNREHIENYVEIFLDVPMQVLEARNPHELYSRAKAGELTEVFGVDIEPEYPTRPDLILKNYGDVQPEESIQLILDYVGISNASLQAPV